MLLHFLKDRVFWYLSGLVGFTIFLLYASEAIVGALLPEWLMWERTHLAVQRLLVLSTVSGATWRFGKTGGFIATLFLGVTALPHMIQMQYLTQPDLFLELLIITAVGIVLIVLIGNWKNKQTHIEKLNTTLMLSEANFRNTIENSPVGIAIINKYKMGDILFANKALLDVYGYGTLAELKTVPSDKRYTPESFAEAQTRREIINQNGIVALCYEQDIVRKDGQVRHLLVSADKVTWNDDDRLLITYQDITERKGFENTLRQISEGVSATTGESFFTTLVTYLARSLNVGYAFIGELQPGDQSKIKTLAVFSNGQKADNFIYDLAGTPCEKVVGKSICTFPDNVQELFPQDSMLVRMGVESYIGVPLFGSSSQPSGLMVVMDTKPIKNQNLATATLKVFASRAAAELERKKGEQQLRRDNDYQMTLNSILSIAQSDDTIESILKKATELLLSVEWLVLDSKGAVFLYDDDAEELVMLSQTNLAEPIIEACAKVPIGKCLCGRAASTGKIQYSSGLDERHEVRFDGIVNHGHYCIPMVSSGKVLGVISLYLRADHEHSEQEESFLYAVADTLTMVIIRKQIEKTRQQQYQQLHSIYQMADILSRTIEIEGIYNAALEAIRDVLCAEKASILLFDPDGVMRFKAWHGLSDNYRLVAEGHSPWSSDVVTPEPILITDVEKEPTLAQLAPIILGEGIRSLGFFPMMSGNKLIGKFMVYYSKIRHFCDGDVQLAQTIANHVAIAIQRRTTQTELESSRTSLINAQRIAHLGNWEWDIVKDTLYWSDEVYRIFGMIPKQIEVSFKTFINSVHSEDRKLVVHAVNTAVGHGRPYNIEHRVVLPDGDIRYVHEQAEVVIDETLGRATKMIGTVQDITDLKKAEDTVNKIQQQYHMILDSAGDGIYGLDNEGRTIFLNPAACRLTGYSTEELIGKIQHNIIHHKYPDGSIYPREECPIYDTYVSGVTNVIDNEVFWRKDGSSFPVEYNSTPTKDSKGNITGATVIFKDVTDKLHSQALEIEAKTARLANQAKNEFLASVSHELRTPLNAIIGFAQVLQDNYFGELNEKQTEYVKDILESGQHQLSLINDILDIAKIEAGKMELEPKLFDVDGLLKNSLMMVKHRAMLHNIELAYKPMEGIEQFKISADERRLKQVMYNLLSNAVKFTPDGGKITVTVDKDTEKMTVSVIDSGIGISKMHQQKIFEGFYQVKSGYTDKTPGTGLGLLITKRIVELHGGLITVSSQGEGTGSKFSFTIPLNIEEK